MEYLKDEELLKYVGARVKMFRDIHHLGPDVLAEKLHISRQHLHRIEIGKYPLNVKHLMLILEYFNITIDEILPLE